MKASIHVGIGKRPKVFVRMTAVVSGWRKGRINKYYQWSADGEKAGLTKITSGQRMEKRQD